jgi:hypothetical protein
MRESVCHASRCSKACVPDLVRRSGHMLGRQELSFLEVSAMMAGIAHKTLAPMQTLGDEVPRFNS